MARLPSSEDLGGLPTPQPNRTVARYDTSAEWAGLASLGEGAMRLGADVQAAWDRVSAEQTESKYSSFEFEELKRYDQAVQGIQPGQAKGFTDKYLQGYFQRAKEFQGGVEGQYRGAVEQKLFGLEKRLWGDAIGFERGEVKRTSLNNLDATFRSVILPFASQAASLPTGDLRKSKLLAEAEAKARKLIDENAALTPIERDELWNGATDDKGNWKAGVRENIQKAFFEGLPDEEQLYADPTRPVETLGDRMRQVESGGDPYAQNPNSSALGADGFLEGTWLGLMEKYHPELTKGKSKSQILAMRTDEQLSGEMRDLYATENSQFLGSRGYGATPGNIYLAHFLGPSGAVQMLGADPNTPADQINPKAAAANAEVFYVNGNPNQPRTGGEIAEWASGLMSGVRHEDWAGVLDALPYDYKVRASQDAAARLVRSEADRLAQEKAARDVWLNDFENGILDGRLGNADIQGAYESGLLTDATDRSRLIEMVQKRDGENMNYAAAVQALTDPSFSFNPFSDDHKKMVNLAYEKGPTQGGAGLRDGDETAVGNLMAVVGRTGIIPSAAVDEVRAMVWTGDRDARDAGFAIMDSLARANYEAVRQGFDERDRKQLDIYQTLAHLPPEELEKELNPAGDPQTRKLHEELVTEGRNIAGKIEPAKILDAFDPGFWYSQPSDELLDGVAMQMLERDFVETYGVAYSRTRGDEAASQELAIKWMGEKWGATEIGSGKFLMTHPPERYFNRVDGSYGWLDDQLDVLVEEKYPGAQEWSVKTMPFTEGAIGVGRAPSYAVVVVDKNGVYQTILPPDDAVDGWPFDYEGARSEADQHFLEDDRNERAIEGRIQEIIPPPAPGSLQANEPPAPEPGPSPTLP